MTVAIPVETVVMIPVSWAENEGTNASRACFIPAKARSTAVSKESGGIGNGLGRHESRIELGLQQAVHRIGQRRQVISDAPSDFSPVGCQLDPAD